jgi:hypothetical protein
LNSGYKNEIDYNLYTGVIRNNYVSNKYEFEGGIEETPTYDLATLFKSEENEFKQWLVVGSLCYDDGKVLPNFIHSYEGT